MTTVKTTYNRRSFFKVSAAAGGGLLLGFSWLASCNPTQEEVLAMPSKWFDINAYIKIGDTGMVTILSPNPEIGQNIKTAMPMIVAEELEVDWKHVIVEQAALNTDWYSRQVAGGSQSIRHGWDSLRMAGATAKHLLVAAAAAQWGVEPSTCKVKKGVITNEKGEKLGYGEVAEAAVKLDAPEKVDLKEAKDYTIIGTDRSNVDIDGIITGKPLFGLDTKREGMLYAAVMRSPAFGQKLASLDDTDARKVNGVKDVFQFKVPLKEGHEVDKVAVVATSTWAAMKGKKALKTTWTANTPAENTADHETQMMALLDKKTKKPRRKDGLGAAIFEEDGVEVFEKIYEAPFLPHNCMEPMNFFAHVTDEKVELVGPIQTPEWLRSRVVNLMGWAEKTGDETADKAAMADAMKRVTVDMTRMGGGFGRRLYGDFAMEATQVSKMANAPIQVVWTREDDMAAGTYRPPMKYKIKAGIKDGKVVGYHLTEACINSNMYGILPNNFPAGAIENYQVDSDNIKSNITIGAWRAPYTNFLASAEQSFFDELAEKMDVDAVQLRLDILENAKKVYDASKAVENGFKTELENSESALTTAQSKLQQNTDETAATTLKTAVETAQAAVDKVKESIAKAKEAKKLLPTGNYEPQRFIDVIKLVTEKGNWGKPAKGEYQGFSAYYSHNTYVAQVAHLTMKDNVPTLARITCAVDCGIVINPLAAKNLVQGGVVDGIGHAMYGDLEFIDGKPSATNFDKFRLIRMAEAPTVDVHFVENGKSPTGLGEPTLPPAGAALANAIYSATKKRLYKQPYVKVYDVLG